MQALDTVLSFGERLSAMLLCAVLSSVAQLPVAVVTVDARCWLTTDATFGAARVDWPTSRSRALRASALWGDAVAVTTGFIGRYDDLA
jgi:aspartokinase